MKRAIRVGVLAGAVALALAGAPARGLAQMPGQPVLQNAFSNPGVTVALNFGAGDHQQAYAGALAWAPGNNRVQLSAGGGVVRFDTGESTSENMATFGARVMVPIALFADGRLGIAAFGGAGGGSREGDRTLHVPVGASIGYRMALGARRGISAYAAPFFGWTRLSADVAEQRVTASAGVFRASFGVDVAVLPSLGLTLGLETGAEAKDGDPGPAGSVFGAGISYAF